jgi:hypothetical protein
MLSGNSSSRDNLEISACIFTLMLPQRISHFRISSAILELLHSLRALQVQSTAASIVYTGLRLHFQNAHFWHMARPGTNIICQTGGIDEEK